MRKLLLLLLIAGGVSANAQSAIGFSLDALPNPFADRTLVSYTLTGADTLTIKVYDQLGVLKVTLRDNVPFSAGAYSDSLIMTAFPDGRYFVAATSLHHGHVSKLIIKDQATGIQMINGISQLQVFPDPVSRELTVSGLPDNSLVSIIGLTGQQLPLKPISDSVFDLSDLPSGLYFLEIRSGDTKRSIKIVKE